MTTPGVAFDNVHVTQTHDQEEGPVTIHGAWYVTSGEYIDEPDTVIRIEHCVDGEGNDRTKALAYAIAGALDDLQVQVDV